MRTAIRLSVLPALALAASDGGPSLQPEAGPDAVLEAGPMSVQAPAPLSVPPLKTALRAGPLNTALRAGALAGDAPSPGVGAARPGAPSVALHDDARWIVHLPWSSEEVAHAYGLVEALGGAVPVNLITPEARMETIEGRECMVGHLLGFDVAEAFAFDIDEAVELTLVTVPERTVDPFHVLWDRSGGEGRDRVEVSPGSGTPFDTVSVTLERARFIGRGAAGVDLAVGHGEETVAICDLRLERSGATEVPADSGAVRLEVRDGATGRVVPARAGLYDATGRPPLPSDDALVVERFSDELSLLHVGPGNLWPSENRQAFYTDGTYGARVPAGEYELVVTKGFEFRAHRSQVEVSPGGEAEVTVELERYADLPGEGWFSGDAHIHAAREEPADREVWTQVAAEDVHVAHLLEMGNISGVHFVQPAWGEEGRYVDDGHALVSGQENPRTAHRGHTIFHNLEEPVRPPPDSYFHYHRAFEEARRQGGFTGYAHLHPLFNARRGLALDVPFGIVDFLEVMQAGQLFEEIWYDFLNLGYRLKPVAGSDFPYIQLPGAVRYYVRADEAFSPDAWFEGFREGRVYVTNGPFLELTVGGASMGSAVEAERGERLEVAAEARLNPDLGGLDRLELVVHGEAVQGVDAEGRDRVSLETELTAEESFWVAVRAHGDREAPVVAHTAPVYVEVGGEPTWDREAVPELVAGFEADLDDLLEEPIEPDGDLESWDTREILREEWEAQREGLRERVEEARERYRRLLAEAERRQR